MKDDKDKAQSEQVRQAAPGKRTYSAPCIVESGAFEHLVLECAKNEVIGGFQCTRVNPTS